MSTGEPAAPPRPLRRHGARSRTPSIRSAPDRGGGPGRGVSNATLGPVTSRPPRASTAKPSPPHAPLPAAVATSGPGQRAKRSSEPSTASIRAGSSSCARPSREVMPRRPSSRPASWDSGTTPTSSTSPSSARAGDRSSSLSRDSGSTPRSRGTSAVAPSAASSPAPPSWTTGPARSTNTLAGRRSSTRRRLRPSGRRGRVVRDRCRRPFRRLPGESRTLSCLGPRRNALRIGRGVDAAPEPVGVRLDESPARLADRHHVGLLPGPALGDQPPGAQRPRSADPITRHQDAHAGHPRQDDRGLARSVGRRWQRRPMSEDDASGPGNRSTSSSGTGRTRRGRGWTGSPTRNTSGSPSTTPGASVRAARADTPRSAPDSG